MQPYTTGKGSQTPVEKAATCQWKRHRYTSGKSSHTPVEKTTYFNWSIKKCQQALLHTFIPQTHFHRFIMKPSSLHDSSYKSQNTY